MLPALVVQAGLEAPSAEVRVLRSEHYELTVPSAFEDGEDWLALAEALHERLREHFGAAPPEETLLQVQFYADQASYMAGLAAEGVAPEVSRAGGVYWTGTRKASFWRQPSRAFTRHLYLHELVHQFHYLAVMDNQPRTPTWYTEGLAEHFSHHTWDGKTLRTGLSDLVMLEENIPSMAAAARSGTLDLEEVASGRLGGPKPESWALIHWLLAGPDKALTERFRKLERRMWAGTPFSSKVFGSSARARERCLSQGLEWLGSLKTTWKIEWIEWDAEGEVLVGDSGVVGLVRARDAALRGGLSSTLEGSGRAGVILGFRSTGEFLAVYHDPRGRVWLSQRTDGRWIELAGAEVPSATRRALAVEVKGGSTIRVTVDGERVLEHEVPTALLAGPPGLFTDACRTRFEGVRLAGAGR